MCPWINIAHPTDARLYEGARTKLMGLPREGGLHLRQFYARKAPRLAVQIGRNAHARQFKRMRQALRTLKGYTGRALRDIRRQLGDIPTGANRERGLDRLVLVSRLLQQSPKSIGKIYAIHDPGQSWIWSESQISSGAIDRATAADFEQIFQTLAEKVRAGSAE